MSPCSIPKPFTVLPIDLQFSQTNSNNQPNNFLKNNKPLNRTTPNQEPKIIKKKLNFAPNFQNRVSGISKSKSRSKSMKMTKFTLKKTVSKFSKDNNSKTLSIIELHIHKTPFMNGLTTLSKKAIK